MVVGTDVRISAVDAIEVLDSRGRPTLQVTLQIEDGRTATAGAPAGASTGRNEAVERRDGDLSRYGGQGVLAAVTSVTGEIAELLRERPWPDQATLDAALTKFDGTDTKARLGAPAAPAGQDQVVGGVDITKLGAGTTPGAACRAAVRPQHLFWRGPHGGVGRRRTTDAVAVRRRGCRAGPVAGSPGCSRAGR